MGFRIIKTAAATLLSILLAAAAGIPNAQSAGLLAILGWKRPVKGVYARFRRAFSPHWWDSFWAVSCSGPWAFIIGY